METVEKEQEYRIRSFYCEGEKYYFSNEEEYKKTISKLKDIKISNITYFANNNEAQLFTSISQEDFEKLRRPSKLIKKIILEGKD